MFDAERFLSNESGHAAEVIREHHGFVLMTCCAYAIGEDEAEDLAQIVWQTVVVKAGSYEGTGSFGAWIHRIAINSCLSHLRAKKVKRETLERYRTIGGVSEESPRTRDPHHITERRELAMSLHRALGRLTEGERIAVTLRILEGRQPQEVAEIMGIKPATVRSHVRHGLNHLRRIMEDPDSDLSRHRAAL